jgi:hypothetical protein
MPDITKVAVLKMLQQSGIREGLLASRPAIYLRIILAVALAAAAYQLRTQSIFSCAADGYSTDRYLAYCNGAGYGDYEHGAFLFDLEPSAQDFARGAEVLFLGNSRLQVALSTAVTIDWFSAASARYYLLGFGYSENMIFANELLRKIRPSATVYVINVDHFFERIESPPVKRIFHDPEARSRYEAKRLWQRVQEPICKTLPMLCGNSGVVFRSRETGAYMKRDKLEITPVSYDQVINENEVKSSTAAAIDFLSRLPVERKCIILTTVPTVGTQIGNVNAIAKALGVSLIAPEISTGLQTYDGSHLDLPSAKRWSEAFFQEAGSRIRSCLEDKHVTLVDSPPKSIDK